MASIYVKFRPSSNKDKTGVIYYQISANHANRQIKTDYRIFPGEWDKSKSEIIVRDNERRDTLKSIKQRMEWDLKVFKHIFKRMERLNSGFDAKDVISFYNNRKSEFSLFHFMDNTIEQLKQMGNIRTSETYRITLNSFKKFRNGIDILLEDIDSELMVAYEAYMKKKGLIKNSTSFYMRILRAVYNRAVDKELTEQRNPFRHVYTGIDKTVKRAIGLKEVKTIKNIDLSTYPALDYARDMFMFSFYTRGMSFIDITCLRKENLNNGILSYRRKKTGKRLNIRWEQCMQDIVDKWGDTGNPYLLPTIKRDGYSERTQYKHLSHSINARLKQIGYMAHITTPLTMYVARHSWASIAKYKNIPVSVISDAMGHDSELTTRIYLASLDPSPIDEANSKILEDL